MKSIQRISARGARSAVTALLLVSCSNPAPQLDEETRQQWAEFDALDGDWVTALATDSTPGIIATQSLSDEYTFLRVECLNDELALILDWSDYLIGNSDNEVKVEFRIDSRDPDPGRHWTLSYGFQGRMPIDLWPNFRRQANSGRTVFFRITDPQDGEGLSHRFSLVGFGRALKRLSCVN